MQTTKCLNSQALGFRAESAGSRSRALGGSRFSGQRLWSVGGLRLYGLQNFFQASGPGVLGLSVYKGLRVSGLRFTAASG